MRTKYTYRTGLLASRDPRFPWDTIRGKNWSLSFVRERRSPPRIYNGREVVIEARDWKTAQQALSLAYCALVLINGEALPFASQGRPIAYCDAQTGPHAVPKQLLHFARGFSLSTADIPEACLIAAKASYNRRYAYALTKYYVSSEIYSTPIVDLDPENIPHLRLSPFYDDHVRFAISITLAYSAIEEVEMQIKATEANPSRLSDGQWNPKVKQELENRLRRAGVDLTEHLLWSARGPARRIDKRRPPKPQFSPKWAFGTVKDSLVDITDALSDASWLRSKVATHGFGRLASSLSPYDVANVQHLARRLILECLGFWRRELPKGRRSRPGA